MKRASTFWLAMLAVVGTMALCSFGALPAEEHAAKATFLERLKLGQPITITEKDGRYEIGMFYKDMRPLAHNIVEIGQDYLVVRDIVGVTDTVIPVYSIKAVRVLRLSGK